MANLLHIDSSVRGEESVSRKLTTRAARAWLAAHPGGTISYRDLGRNPLPHIDAASAQAGMTPPEQRSEAQRASWALTEELVGEIKAADTVLLGLPLYNYGARARSSRGSTTSSLRVWRWTRRPGRACWAGASSS